MNTNHVAVHEAAHAVISLLNGGTPAHDISIIPDTDEAGNNICRCDRWQRQFAAGSSASKKPNERYLDVVGLMAGPVAECRKRSPNWDEVDLQGLDIAHALFHLDSADHPDLQVIRDRLLEEHGDRAEDKFRAYWADAVELLKFHWPAVCELASSLKVVETITPSQASKWWSRRD